jgi:copper chaperone
MKVRFLILMGAVLALSISSFAGTKANKTVDIKVEGMTCQGCVSKVTNALQKADGVKEAKVNLDAGNAAIVFDTEKTSEKALYKVINASGFKAVAKEAKAGEKMACPADCAGECCADKKVNKET